MDNEPREFYIKKRDVVLTWVYEGLEELNDFHGDITQCIHVIEKTAYDELKDQVEYLEDLISFGER